MISFKEVVLVICLQGSIFGNVFHNGFVVATKSAYGTTFSAANGENSEAVSSSVLQFAHNMGIFLNENSNFGQAEIFSPISIMSSMALLLLGSKGKRYDDLKHILGLDAPSLKEGINGFHAEFGAMIQEMQNGSVSLQRRNKDNWRNTNVAYNIQNKIITEDHHGSAGQSIIKVVNGLFVKNGFDITPLYRDVITSIYKSEVIPLDFNTPFARDHINEWIYNKTFGKISSIITENLSADTNAIMASALYFKAFWGNPFLRGATIIDDFYPDGSQHPPTRVAMMATGGAFPFYNSIENGCRIIGLPYTDNFTTAYVIQPNDSNRGKLRNLLNILDAEKIEAMISKMVYKNAVIAFPKMHLTRNINVNKVLRGLGLREVSLKDRNNLPVQREAVARAWSRAEHGIKFPTDEAEKGVYYPSVSTEQLLDGWNAVRNTPNNLISDLLVGDILHKVDFVVDENGTEGAAATVTYLKRSGVDVLFRADTPFLMLVRHDATKLPLFYGIVNNPSPNFS